MPYASYPSIIASFNAKYIILAHKDDSILYKHRYTCVVSVYIYIYYCILCNIYNANQLKKGRSTMTSTYLNMWKTLFPTVDGFRNPAITSWGIGSFSLIIYNRCPKNIQQGRGSLGFLNPSTSRPPWPSKLRKWHRSLPSSRSPEFCGVTRIPKKKPNGLAKCRYAIHGFLWGG